MNGLSNSHYLPTHTQFTNPASIVNTLTSMDINFIGLSMFQNNNYSSVNVLYPFLLSNYEFPKYLSDRLTAVDNTVNFATEIDLRGPAFTINWNKPLKPINAFTVFTRTRTIFSGNNLNRNFISLMDKTNSNTLSVDEASAQTKNQIYKFDNADITTQSFTEIGVGYGRQLFKKEKHYLTGAITLKLLMGYYFKSIQTSNTTIRFRDPSTPSGEVSGQATPLIVSDTTLSIRQPIQKAAYNDNSDIFIPFNVGNALGFGVDIGFSYEIRPTYQKYWVYDSAKTNVIDEINCTPKYLLKTSVSLLDVGFISYLTEIRTTKDNTNAFISSKVNFNKKIGDIIKSVDAFEQTIFHSQLKDTLSREIIYDSVKATTTVGIPTRLHINVDLKLPFNWSIFNYIYLNFGWTKSVNLISTDFKSNWMDNISFNMRYSKPNFEIALPVSIYYNALPQFPYYRFGLAGRYKWGFIGFDDIGSVFGAPYSHGSSIYFGVHYAINRPCPNDKKIDSLLKDTVFNNPTSVIDTDKDGVIDVLDKCVLITGPSSNSGCPLNQDSLLQSHLNAISQSLTFSPNSDSITNISSLNIDTLNYLLTLNPNKTILVSAPVDTSSALTPKEKDSLSILKTQKLLNTLTPNGVNKNFIGVPLRYMQPPIVPPLRIYINGRDEDRDGVLDDVDACPTLPGAINEKGCPIFDLNTKEGVAQNLGDQIDFWKGLKYFAYASDEKLRTMGKALLKDTTTKLLVRPFANADISDYDFNNELAQKRADTIKLYLVNNFKINPNRIVALGMAPEEPYGSVPLFKYYQDTDDLDNDNISDKTDKCPTLRGVISRNGCPHASQKILYNLLDSLAKEIDFEEDKDQLKKKSTDALMQIYALIQQYPNLNVLMRIGAFSDKLSNPQKNILAQQRAKVLQNYFNNLGVENGRMAIVGLGYQQPAYQRVTATPLTSRLIDADGDGVKDYEDRCYSIEGSLSEYGCPKLLYEDEQTLNKINDKLLFDQNNQTTLDTSALPYVNKLIDLLNTNPNYNIVITGNFFDPKLSEQKIDLINEIRVKYLKKRLLDSGISPLRLNTITLSVKETHREQIEPIRIVHNTTDLDRDWVKDIYDRCPLTIGSVYNRGCPYDTKALKRASYVSNTTILFDFNSSTILPENIFTLEEIIKLMIIDTTLHFIVYGHADNIGDIAFNEALSLRRANTIKKFILSTNTISEDRLIPIGLGDKFPIKTNTTAIGRRDNRRVEFLLLE